MQEWGWWRELAVFKCRCLNSFKYKQKHIFLIGRLKKKNQSALNGFILLYFFFLLWHLMWSGHTDDSLCMCGFHIPPTDMYRWLSGDCDGYLPHLQHMPFCLFVCFVCLAAHSLSPSLCVSMSSEQWGGMGNDWVYFHARGVTVGGFPGV